MCSFALQEQCQKRTLESTKYYWWLALKNRKVAEELSRKYGEKFVFWRVDNTIVF